MTIVRVGLIGYGYSGATFHAPLIATVNGLVIARIASSNADKVRHDFPDVTLAQHPDGVISAPDVDLIVIATPNNTHHLLAKQALLSGKHVVVEKPFTVTTAEAAELVELAAEKNRVLSVFHNRRWDNDFLTVRRCIESGMLGEINTYESHFDRYRPDVRQRWREQDVPGGGILYDLGSHLLDQALVLFGRPHTLFADIGIQRTGGAAVDYFHLVLGYGAKRVLLHSGAIIRRSGPRFQVHGSVGSYIKQGLDPQEDALKAGQRPGDTRWGIEPESAYGHITREHQGTVVDERVETLTGSYQTYYQGIFDALTRGTPVPVPAGDALNVIQMIEHARRSSREQRVIAVNKELTHATAH
ncbi:MAG: oxidoreductase [Gammaproteobacteria bacterium]|nr:oxidoreductase [Gammaproteobacteria bacterium]